MNRRDIQRSKRGFSLLQIMLAVAVVGILAGIAIPAYQDSVVRSRVAEALEFADVARVKVEEALMTGHKAPRDLLDATGGSVDMMTALTWVEAPSGGYILPEMDLPGLGKRKAFAMVVSDTGDGAHWTCVNAAKMNYPDALADKYLPASCRGDGSKVASASMTIPSKPAAQVATGGISTSAPSALPKPSCASGDEAVRVENAEGKQVFACFRKCPGGTIRSSLNAFQCNPVAPQAAATTRCGADEEKLNVTDSTGVKVDICVRKCPAGAVRDRVNFAQCNVAVTNSLSACPQGQDCSQASNCPPGEELPGGKCVAKCQPGWEPNNADRSTCTISGSAAPHLCHGPKFICERSHRIDPAGCPQETPIAANSVENLRDGSRYVLRKCISVSDAFKAVEHNAKHPSCANYDVQHLVDSHFSCTFPCYGSACNLNTVPNKGLLTWANQVLDPATGQMRAKTEADLPDQFDTP